MEIQTNHICRRKVLLARQDVIDALISTRLEKKDLPNNYENVFKERTALELAVFGDDISEEAKNYFMQNNENNGFSEKELEEVIVVVLKNRLESKRLPINNENIAKENSIFEIECFPEEITPEGRAYIEKNADVYIKKVENQID